MSSPEFPKNIIKIFTAHFAVLLVLKSAKICKILKYNLGFKIPVTCFISMRCIYIILDLCQMISPSSSVTPLYGTGSRGHLNCESYWHCGKYCTPLNWWTKRIYPSTFTAILKLSVLSLYEKSLYRVQLASHFSFVAINADLTAANEFYQRCVSGASKTDVCYCTIKSAFMVANEKREATCSYSHSKAISIFV